MKNNYRRKKSTEIIVNRKQNKDFVLRSTGKWLIFRDWWNRNITRKFSVPKQLFVWYLIITFIGAILLWSPITHSDLTSSTFIDALFTSSSAFSDTGLTVTSIGNEYNVIGEVIIFIEIFLGGIGWFTIKIFLITFIFSKVSTKAKIEYSEESGSNLKDAKGIAITAIIISILATLVFGTAMGMIFYYTPPTNEVFVPLSSSATSTSPQFQGNLGKSLWSGYFLAASSINNAGFDIIGSYSLRNYYSSYLLQSLILFLFILGGMGFGIIYDFQRWVRSIYTNKNFRFSLVTKVSVVSYLSVAIVGLISAYSFELSAAHSDFANSFLGSQQLQFQAQDGETYSTQDYGTLTNRYFAIFFNTMSTRNAGFSTIDLNSLSIGTITSYDIMMFIGSGPGSTAGGIRTTTWWIILAVVYSVLRSNEDYYVFKHRINNEDIKKTTITLFSGILIVMLAVFIITGSENGRSTQMVLVEDSINASGVMTYVMMSVGISFSDAMFISFSAFGTTGLSTINIATLTVASKITLIIVMFIGQLGALKILEMMSPKNSKFNGISYVGEEISVG